MRQRSDRFLPRNLRRAALAACPLLTVLAAAGCDRSVKTLELDPKVIQLTSRGQTATIVAIPKNAAGERQRTAQVTWKSSTPGVATVKNGDVTAVGSGKATITASSGGVQSQATVEVFILSKLEVTPDKVTIEGIPGSTTVTAKVKDDRGQDQPPKTPLEWTSSHPDVVKVENGNLTAVAEGTATITVRYQTLEAKVPVTVKIPAFEKVKVEPAKLVMKQAGETATLSASALDAQGNPVKGVPLGYESTNAKVATVTPDGKVSAVGRGAARIIVSYGRKGMVVPVTVRKR